jgi:methionyl-tRNA synthetase
MNKEKYYITTPIYYVNDKLHIGHAYTTILADVLARYHRLTGVPTFLLTGSDEHGQKVQEAAAKTGITPQQHADSMVVRFQELWKTLEITNDDFIRTTEQRHKTVVQNILQDLYQRDEIYKADYDGWYCVTCERFYMEKDLTDGKCPEHGCGRPVERIRESNYFFRMSKYQEWLIQYIEEHPGFILPEFRRNETLGFLRKKLNDLCISRPKTRLSWGIELPFDKDYVTYVWFDALINYITAAGYLSDDAKFAKWWPASCHLVGKDILTTHTVYWPTMLRAMNVPQPETIFAHGWWLSDNEKMSKTLGNTINPLEVSEQYGTEPFRYFLMAEMATGQDANFTEDAFVRRYNADLANDLGNLLSRIMKLIGSNFDGKIPQAAQPSADEDHLKEVCLSAANNMIAAVDNMRVDLGLADLVNAIREVNRYLEKTQPWTLAKEGKLDALGTVLYTAAEALRIISGMLHPVMPEKMKRLRSCLGLQEENPDFSSLKEWGKLVPGTTIGKMESLFPRIVRAAPTVPAPAPETSTLLDYADFSKVQLRTAKVLEAEKVQGADKLLRLQIEIGKEKRQIVAGIAQHYTPEQVIGKTIIVVANLKPAKIRGVESNGMLLAASADGSLRLLTVDSEVPSGSTVK